MRATERFICIHGHYYQPPRENPWLEAIEPQPSAAPYHDWNERIHAECYAPNAAARVLDGRDRIARIVSNYARTSFNFGPTLLSWMAEHATDTLAALVEADRQSQKRFSGHGSAMAQVYNHMIMPLANERDRRTQVAWGIADFEHRFGRKPEGMWLAETAVDTASLEALAAQGIQFTILAPRQCVSTRPLNSAVWTDVHGDPDTTRPYRVELPSGRHIAVFFYDGPISQAVAFERLLSNGERFAGRLVGAFGDETQGSPSAQSAQTPPLVHIATDGETYGHHHRYGDMALAYALLHIEEHKLARLTCYGEFLERFPPAHEAKIAEKSSWSCAHGVERWRSDCGCRMSESSQAWRSPLREGLDGLRDQLARLFDREGQKHLIDPWVARDAYIQVVLSRSTPQAHGTTEAFLAAHAKRSLSRDDRSRVLALLEMQRHAMLMFTSCGWFFDDPSGLETVQILQYAARASHLAEEVAGQSFERDLVTKIASMQSRAAEEGDGRRIWEKRVLSAKVELVDVGAHVAACRVLGAEPRSTAHTVRIVKETRHEAPRPEPPAEVHHGSDEKRATLWTARLEVESLTTGQLSQQHAAVLAFEDFRLSGTVWEVAEIDGYERFDAWVSERLGRGDLVETLRRLSHTAAGDQEVPAPSRRDPAIGKLATIESLDAVFREEQSRIIESLLAKTLSRVESTHRALFEQTAPLLRHLAPLRCPAPRPLVVAGEWILAVDAERAARRDPPDTRAVAQCLARAKSLDLRVDWTRTTFEMARSIRALAEKWEASPTREDVCQALLDAVDLASKAKWDVDLWRAQNACYRLGRTVYPELAIEAAHGDASAARHALLIERLAEALSVRLPPERQFARLAALGPEAAMLD